MIKNNVRYGIMLLCGRLDPMIDNEFGSMVVNVPGAT
jgi:hypothetical protein